MFLCLGQVIHHAVEPSFVLRLVKVDHLLDPLDQLEAYVVLPVQPLYRGGRYLHLWELPVWKNLALFLIERCVRPTLQSVFAEEVVDMCLTESESSLVIEGWLLRGRLPIECKQVMACTCFDTCDL